MNKPVSYDDSHHDATIENFFTLQTLSSLKNAVRVAIGPIATPDFVVYSDLPKVMKPHTHTHMNHGIMLPVPSRLL